MKRKRSDGAAAALGTAFWRKPYQATSRADLQCHRSDALGIHHMRGDPTPWLLQDWVGKKLRTDNPRTIGKALLNRQPENAIVRAGESGHYWQGIN